MDQNTAKQWKLRKVKESIYIANLKPSFNKLLKSFELRLFPRRITWQLLSVYVFILNVIFLKPQFFKPDDVQVDRKRLLF